MIRRVLFNVEHLNILELQPDFSPILNFDGVRFILSKLPLPNADALTLMDDGRILCCFGYIQLLPGVAEVWLLPSVYVRDSPVALVSEVKGYLESTAKVFQWHRIQTVTQDIPYHRKWMHVLGFEEEGVLKKYFDKQDYIMSARYFDWSNP